MIEKDRDASQRVTSPAGDKHGAAKLRASEAARKREQESIEKDAKMKADLAAKAAAEKARIDKLSMKRKSEDRGMTEQAAAALKKRENERASAAEAAEATRVANALAAKKKLEEDTRAAAAAKKEKEAAAKARADEVARKKEQDSIEKDAKTKADLAARAAAEKARIEKLSMKRKSEDRGMTEQAAAALKKRENERASAAEAAEATRVANALAAKKKLEEDTRAAAAAKKEKEAAAAAKAAEAAREKEERSRALEAAAIETKLNREAAERARVAEAADRKKKEALGIFVERKVLPPPRTVTVAGVKAKAFMKKEKFNASTKLQGLVRAMRARKAMEAKRMARLDEASLVLVQAKLRAAVAAAGDDAQKALAAVFKAAFVANGDSGGDSGGGGDGGGQPELSPTETKALVRGPLGVAPAELPDPQLTAFVNTVDTDGSGAVSLAELAAFLAWEPGDDTYSERVPACYCHLLSALASFVLEAAEPAAGEAPEGASLGVHLAKKKEGSARQAWRLCASGHLELALGGLVLDVGQGKRRAKGELCARPREEGNQSQVWRVTAKGELENAGDGLLLTVKGGNRTAKADLWMNTRKNSKAQVWVFDDAKLAAAATKLQASMRAKMGKKAVAAKRSAVEEASEQAAAPGEQVRPELSPDYSHYAGEVSVRDGAPKPKPELSSASATAADAQADAEAAAAAATAAAAGTKAAAAALKDMAAAIAAACVAGLKFEVPKGEVAAMAVERAGVAAGGGALGEAAPEKPAHEAPCLGSVTGGFSGGVPDVKGAARDAAMAEVWFKVTAAAHAAGAAYAQEGNAADTARKLVAQAAASAAEAGNEAAPTALEEAEKRAKGEGSSSPALPGNLPKMGW